MEIELLIGLALFASGFVVGYLFAPLDHARMAARQPHGD